MDDLYVRLCSFENLLLAFRKARKKKTQKPYVREFERHLGENLGTVLKSSFSCLSSEDIEEHIQWTCASTRSMASLSPASGSTPTIRSTSLPEANTMRQGILDTPYSCGAVSFSSTLSLAKRNLPL